MACVTKVRPREAGASENFPEGLNRARLVAAKLKDPNDDGSPIMLRFVNAPFRHTEYLHQTRAAEARKALFAKRMGAGFGDADEECDVDWEQFVGTEYVIDVFEDEYDGKKNTKMQFAGIYPLDHQDQKVRDFLKTPTGKTPARVPVDGGDSAHANGNGKSAARQPVNVDDI